MESVENIVDLPKEILIIIFEYLYPSDRRVLSQCCKVMEEIWLRSNFISDRRLLFKGCRFSPVREPFSLFMNTERTYEHVAFKNVVFPRETDEINACGKLWEKLGETVTTMEFLYSKVSSWPDKSFWQWFPKLKTFHFYGIEKIDEYYFEFLPKSLEKIIIAQQSDFYFEDMFYEMEITYLQKRSDPISLELDQFTLEVKSIKHHLSNLHKLDIGAEEINEYKNFHGNNVKHLTVNCVSLNIKQQASFLANLDEKFPQLEVLNLATRNFLPQSHWNQLKKFRIHVDATKYGLLKELHNFGKLEKLEVVLESGNTCFFIHEITPNQSLKELMLYHKDYFNGLLCLECTESITKSFPNIRELLLDEGLVTNDHMHLLENLTKLKELDIVSPNTMLTFGNFSTLTTLKLSRNVKVDLDTWPTMHFLRKLKISLDMSTPENIERILQNLPTIEYLDVSCHDEVEKVFDVSYWQTLVKYLKRLKTFKYDLWWGYLSSYSFPYDMVQLAGFLTETCKFIAEIKLVNASSERFDSMDNGSFSIDVKPIFESSSSLRTLRIDRHTFFQSGVSLHTFLSL